MHIHYTTEEFRTQRRGVIAVQVAVMLVMLLGFAALTLDMGSLYNARADLQHAADASALAGASVYTTDAMMTVRMGTGGTSTLAGVTSMATARVHEFASINPTFGLSTTMVQGGDIQTGSIDLYSATSTIQVGPAPADYNAVRVMIRRESGTSDANNGPVEFYFAPILGKLFGESSASAVAVFDDRMSGFAFDVPGAGVFPFTIHEDAFNQDLASGGDQYAYNGGGNIDNAPDGIREIRIFPYPLSGSGYTDGDGSFGILNIGTGNQGVDAERVQIIDGVTDADMTMEIGTASPTFFDSSGNPVTYDITGSPGLEVSLKDAVSTLIGEVVGFFLHTNVVLSGSNAVYTITALRFGRVMDVKLTGPPSGRGIYIQPVSYNGGGVKLDPQAPSTNGLVGRIVLAR